MNIEPYNPEDLNFIEEVHNVETYTGETSKQFPGHTFVRVELTISRGSTGATQKLYRIWTADRWNVIKERGYFIQ